MICTMVYIGDCQDSTIIYEGTQWVLPTHMYHRLYTKRNIHETVYALMLFEHAFYFRL
jgi:hypothetical protein